jgi:hypothetical protein
MSDEAADLYGKIDALLGKRVGFASAVARHREENDFPLLTEVVEAEAANTEPITLDYERAFHPPPAPPEIPELTEPSEPWPEPPSLSPAAAICGDTLTPEPEVEPVPEPAPEPAIEENPPTPREEGLSADVTPAPASAASDEPMSMDISDARIEAMLRRIIREELERVLGPR